MAKEDEIKKVEEFMKNVNNITRSNIAKGNTKTKGTGNMDIREKSINNIDPSNDLLEPQRQIANSIRKYDPKNLEYERVRETDINRKNREANERRERIIDTHNKRIEKQEHKEARKSKIKDFFREFFKALRKPFIKAAAIGTAAATLLPAAAAITKDHKGDATNNEQKTKLVDNNPSNNRDENNIYDQAYNEIHNDDTQNKGRISNLAENTNKKQLINKVENKIIYFLSKKGINNVSKIFIGSNNLYSARTIYVNPQNGAVRENYRPIGTHITDEQKRAMDIIKNLNSGNLKGNQESEQLNELYGLVEMIDEQINEIENNMDMDQPSIQSDNIER